MLNRVVLPLATGAALDRQAARLAALPPPQLPPPVASPGHDAPKRSQPPDAVMDALHGWLSSAAMERLLRLRIGESTGRCSNLRVVPPQSHAAMDALRNWLLSAVMKRLQLRIGVDFESRWGTNLSSVSC